MTTTCPDLIDPSDATAMAFVPPEPGEVFRPKPAPKAPDVVRENDGRRQLVGYLGWKTILHRLAARHP